MSTRTSPRPKTPRDFKISFGERILIDLNVCQASLKPNVKSFTIVKTVRPDSMSKKSANLLKLHLLL